MAAQHLHRNLVRPNSGLKELAQTMKTETCKAQFQHEFINSTTNVRFSGTP